MFACYNFWVWNGVNDSIQLRVLATFVDFYELCDFSATVWDRLPDLVCCFDFSVVGTNNVCI